MALLPTHCFSKSIIVSNDTCVCAPVFKLLGCVDTAPFNRDTKLAIKDHEHAPAPHYGLIVPSGGGRQTVHPAFTLLTQNILPHPLNPCHRCLTTYCIAGDFEKY